MSGPRFLTFETMAEVAGRPGARDRARDLEASYRRGFLAGAIAASRRAPRVDMQRWIERVCEWRSGDASRFEAAPP